MDENNSKNNPSSNFRCRGREFNSTDLNTIETIVDTHYERGRKFISLLVCETLKWHQPNGRPKDRACRDVLTKLDSLGKINLPPGRVNNSPRTKGLYTKKKLPAYLTSLIWPQNLDLPEGRLKTLNIEVKMVRWSPLQSLWNHLVSEYHYLHSSLIVGRHLKYLILLDGRAIGCIGWGEPAWHLNKRDLHIGWSVSARQRNLGRLVNNVRFLILPWISKPNLASRILSMAANRLVADWEEYYQDNIVLVESFIDDELYLGTCYKAAGWVNLGSTAGWSRKGYSYAKHKEPKSIYIKPLNRDYISLLCQE